jgi:membrane protease YdiL (CAAX protease family)
MSKLFLHKKNIPRTIVFWLFYFAAIALCLFAVQFLPRRWWWYGWGTTASLTAFILTRYFIKKEKDAAQYDWLKPGRNTLLRVSCGIAAGMAIITGTVWVLIQLLHLEIMRTHTSFSEIVFWNAALIPCAFQEELGFRYYTLKKLNRNLSLWKSQLVVATVFALYHVIGGQDIINAFCSTTLWSVIFGLSAHYSKGIALPTGIHAGSTIGQAIFGIKLQEGFPSACTLAETGLSAPHKGFIVLVVQAIILIGAISIIVIIHHFHQKKSSRL